MRTTNPALGSGAFSNLEETTTGEPMTMSGTATKTGVLMTLVLLTAGWTWMKFFKSGGDPAAVTSWMLGGVFAGLVLAMMTIFKKEWAPATAPLYALAEGFFIGGISALFEVKFPGIVIQATALTFGTLASLLIAYRSGFIQVTEKFRLGVVAATGGIALFYLVAMILGFFGISIPFLYQGGFWGIAFSLFVVVIAALNLVLDFDLIEQGCHYRLPKYMEWYCGFALMVTLIWLYVEFLRLLSKVRER